MARIDRVRQTVNMHDSQLTAKLDNGIIGVYRKAHTCERYKLEGGLTLVVTKPFHHFIFALTDNWNVTGKPVEWGLDPIVNRLKAIDTWNREDMIDEMIESYEEEKKSNERNLKNNVESFLREFRRPFAKAFNDVNTSTLEKTDRRRL